MDYLPVIRSFLWKRILPVVKVKANTNNGVMEVYWFRLILWSICACAVGVNALKDPEFFDSQGDYHQNTSCFCPEHDKVVKEGMCKWCAGNVSNDEWFEQCSRRDAVICNVHKLQRLVHQVTFKSSKEYRNALLSSHRRREGAAGTCTTSQHHKRLSMMSEDTFHSETRKAVMKKKKSKHALSEVAMWSPICVVGLIIVGVIIILFKICRQRLCPQRPETHRYGLSPDRNPNTDDAEVDYGSGSLIDGSAVSSLDVDILYQDDALEPVSMVRPTGPDAASIESGSTNDDYMGPYRVIEDSYSAQRPKRKHKTSDDESPHVIL